ncbi:MAG: oligosaccharide flippase family protein [Candidatus Melainabacteria bacterium]|nr:oligosaccharide flippase family protein [Candidatus Melainabacteria bacterium]MBI3307937.1 oligosaccharide flippase family protein [Candidatus Melainabacteria bacterium]
MSLRYKAISSVVWNSIGNYIRVIFNFVGQLILVRLLVPDDFGIYAFVVAILEFFSFLIGWNFPLGVIQMPEDDELSDTAFVLTIVQSVLYMLFFLIVGLVLVYASKSRIAFILFFIALSYSLGPISQMFVAGMQKKLNFKNYSIANTASGIGSIVIAVALAFFGFGLWSLVARDVLYALFSMVSFKLISHFTFKWRFNNQHARNLCLFTGKIFINRWLEGVVSKLDILLGGILLVPAKLGFYSQGKYLISLPSVALAPAMGTTLFSVYSTIQCDEAKLRETNKFMNYFLLRAIIPITLLFFIFPDFIVTVLFGEKWRGSIDIVKWLAFYPLVSVLFENQKLLLQSKGIVEKPIWVLAIQGLVSVILILLGNHYLGFEGIAIGFLVSSVIGYIYICCYSKNYIASALKEYVVPVLLTLLIYLVIALIKASTTSSPLLTIGLMLLFVLLYSILLVIFERKVFFERIKYIVNGLFNKA